MGGIEQRERAELPDSGESEIYRDLMRFRPADLSANAWAVRAGVSRAVWSDMRRHGNPSRRTLEKLLSAANSSLAEFEALRLGSQAGTTGTSTGGGTLGDMRAWEWNPARLPSLPLIATSLAGDWGGARSGIELTQVRPDELIDRLPRPPSLASDRDAYALTVVGDSMWPRFRPGRRIAVSVQAPIALGDDVVVRLRSETASVPALIKELVKRTNEWVELRQFNPDLLFRVEADAIDVLHKVMGELI